MTATRWTPSAPASSAAHLLTAAWARSPGVIVGAVLMGVINPGMSVMGIDQNFQKVVKGGVLLAAVVFDVLSSAMIPDKRLIKAEREFRDVLHRD